MIGEVISGKKSKQSFTRLSQEVGEMVTACKKLSGSPTKIIMFSAPNAQNMKPLSTTLISYERSTCPGHYLSLS